MLNKKYQFSVTIDDDNNKLSQFITDHIPHFSHSKAKEAIKNQLVAVNQVIKTDPLTTISNNDLIDIDLRQGTAPRYRIQSLLRNMEIVFEDDDIIVINKPAGILVHQTEDKEKGTLVELIHRYWRKRKQGPQYLKVVHRIDKETSGLVVFPKNAHAHRILGEQFKNHKVKRSYLAVVHGHVEPRFGQFQSYLVHETKGKARRGSSDKEGVGKLAITNYSVKDYFSNYTLVECWLETGRTHQIRIHFSEAGYPLLGEDVYIDKNLRKHQHFKRQALHAATLSFKHPVTGENVHFTANLPEDMANYMKR